MSEAVDQEVLEGEGEEETGEGFEVFVKDEPSTFFEEGDDEMEEGLAENTMEGSSNSAEKSPLASEEDEEEMEEAPAKKGKTLKNTKGK